VLHEVVAQCAGHRQHSKEKKDGCNYLSNLCKTYLKLQLGCF
jgi:hypothetical protein